MVRFPKGIRALLKIPFRGWLVRCLVLPSLPLSPSTSSLATAALGHFPASCPRKSALPNLDVVQIPDRLANVRREAFGHLVGRRGVGWPIPKDRGAVST